jgi:hypothetical protein
MTRKEGLRSKLVEIMDNYSSEIKDFNLTKSSDILYKEGYSKLKKDDNSVFHTGLFGGNEIVLVIYIRV